MNSLPKKSFPKPVRKLPSEFLDSIIQSYREINPSSRAFRFTEEDKLLLSQTLDRYTLILIRFLSGADVGEDLYMISKRLKQFFPNTPYSGDSLAKEVLGRWIDDIYNQLIPQ